MDHETLEIVRAFVAESLDSLDEQEEKIQSLTESGSKESIHSIFRVFHTIKGLSGFLGFNTINTVTHETEALLDLLRSKPETIVEAVRNLIHDSFDILRALLASVSSTMNDKGHEEQVRGFIGSLQGAISAIKSGGIVPDSPTSSSFRSSPFPVARSSSVPSLLPAQSATALAPPPLVPNVNMLKQDVGALVMETTQAYEELVRKNTVLHEQHNITTPFDGEQTDDFEKADIERITSLREVGESASALTPQTSEMNDFADISVALTGAFQHYITEALNLVATTEEGCLRLEQNPHDMTAIGSILGAIQNLKATSGFRDGAGINAMTEELEDIVEAVRSKTLKMYPGLIAMMRTNAEALNASIQGLLSSSFFSETQGLQSRSEEKTDSAKTVLPLLDNYAETHGERLKALSRLVGDLIRIEKMIVKNHDAAIQEPISPTSAPEMLNNVIRDLQEVIRSMRVNAA